MDQEKEEEEEGVGGGGGGGGRSKGKDGCSPFTTMEVRPPAISAHCNEARRSASRHFLVSSAVRSIEPKLICQCSRPFSDLVRHGPGSSHTCHVHYV